MHQTRTAPLHLSGRGYRVWAMQMLFDAFIATVRLAERLGGPTFVSWFVRPIAVGDALQRGRDYLQFLRLRRGLSPGFWHGLGPARHYLQMAWTGYDSLCALLVYDRWGSARWKKRFTIVGTPPQALSDWGRRPVVLAFQHTGAFGVIVYWLRAQGIPSAYYAGGLPPVLEREAYCRVMERGDRQYGLAGAPLMFQRQRGLRDAIPYLQPGHVLAMPMDGARLSPELDAFEAGERPILAKCGAARLAAQAGAVLVPVAARRVGPCRFELHFGRPVPDALLAKEDFRGATQHLVSELWPALAERPRDLNWTTLEALAPELRGKRQSWP